MKKIINKIINKINFREEKGFTIMETLVAIFILLISITGPMVFSQNGLRAAFQARDQVTAFYLAQDVIEFIKNRRDHNILQNDPVDENWFSGLEDCVADESSEFGCTIDTTTAEGDIQQCTGWGSHPGCLGEEDDGSEDNKLRIDGNGFFVNNDDPGTTESIFARNVYIRPIGDSDIGVAKEAEIVVKVRWTSHDTIGVRDITVVEYIYNWGGELGL